MTTKIFTAQKDTSVADERQHLPQSLLNHQLPVKPSFAFHFTRECFIQTDPFIASSISLLSLPEEQEISAHL